MQTKESVHAAVTLEGKTAVVTGAGSGIGRASAEVLAAVGATVYCADIDGAQSEATAASIIASGGKAVGVACDVADKSQVEALINRATSDTGRLDVMCNIAGFMAESKVIDLPESQVDQVFAVNVKGAIFGCQLAGAFMVEHGGGSIINMASTAVMAASPDIVAYAMSKAAVVQLTKTMAVEVGKYGVRVNAIAPGFVPTKMTSRYYTRPDGSLDEEMMKAVLTPMAKFAPLRRVGDPVDIAHAVLYLASDLSTFVTGQLLAPNGGVASTG